MTISGKLLLTLGGVLLATAVAVHFLHHHVIYHTFEGLERERAERDAQRTVEAIRDEVDKLLRTASDYGDWDATRNFIRQQGGRGAGEAFVRENYDTNPLGKISVNLLALADPQGRRLACAAADLAGERSAPLADEVFAWASRRDVFRQVGKGGEKWDVIPTSLGPMLLVSTHVPTEQEGPDSMGCQLVGRLVSAAMVEEARQRTRVELAIEALPVPASGEAGAGGGAGEGARISDVSVEERPEALVSTAQVLDGSGRPALKLTARSAREMSARGQAVVDRMTLWVAAGSLVALAALVLLTRRLVVGPLATLTRHAESLGASGDLGRRIELGGRRGRRRDELGRLADEFNRMGERLADYHAKLMAAARSAGMAEVAAGAVHNVGNVLNSIGVATSVIAGQVRGSKSPNVARVVALLKEHAADLGAFLAGDPRGSKVPAYLEELAGQLRAEREACLEAVARLEEEVGHAREIVRAQQACAGRAAAVLEPVRLAELIGQAVRMTSASLARHEVTVDVGAAGALEAVRTDRSRLLQVLVNLLSNAKDAVKGLEPGRRRVEVRAEAAGGGEGAGGGGGVRIEVRDNGVGIRPEHLTRLFDQGFTTKPDGTGIGLHYCALAVKELGGALRAESAGEGRGARLVLELPAEPPASAAEARGSIEVGGAGVARAA